MKKFLITLSVLLAVILPTVAQTTGTGYAMNIKDFSIQPGETKTLYVNMDNAIADEIVAFQFDIELPEGLSFALNNRGKAIASLTDRAYDHTISSNIQSNGALRVIVVSMNNEFFSGTTGDVIGIDVIASEEFDASNYTISLYGISLANKKATEYMCDNFNYVVETEPTPEPEPIADYAMNIKDFSIQPGETKTLYVNMDNIIADEIVAFQFDIELPEGLSFALNNRGKAIASLTDRAYDHTISSNIQSNGALRVIVVSMNNEFFSGTTGDVIGIDVIASEEFDASSYTIGLYGISLANKKATEYMCDNFDYIVGGTSGIDDALVANIIVSVDGGDIIINGVSDNTVVEVYNIAGSLVYAGTDSRIAVAPHSLYIVKINNAVYKVAL